MTAVYLRRLRKLRKTLADAAGVPPYIVFNDVTLAQMAAEAPRTEQQFLKISGVGESKLKNYGAQFLAEIQNFLNSSSGRRELAYLLVERKRGEGGGMDFKFSV